ncbi:TIGR03085 family protein [Actinacidiphila yanglinensis]|uniref:TIGR03085 family protein n=1 Tax=Actinacidiphila yanglinensis TaxID=310779 RepID=A0A1H5TQL2_9ACTN|nr:TIGR03085 family metal-binding protein [Actinacidiphila yanglinensis]SEF64287.1 TIGR03085 family protein [Actinacidiphila yanglinensis]
MTTHAQRERLLFADLLERSGPDAPTLCAGWTTKDLAAHVVVRERRGDAAVGMVVPQLADRLARVRKEYAEKPYAELLHLIRTGPPRLSPFSLKQLDEASNTLEFYVHTEDVRRAAPEWTPRTIDPVFADALWARLERAARLFGRRSPVGIVLRVPDGRTVVAHKGAPVVTVTGEPSELTMFAFGRQAAAKVDADGPEDAVAQAYGAKLGV